MRLNRQIQLTNVAAHLGCPLPIDWKSQGLYVAAVRHDSLIYLSGQYPYSGDVLAVRGRVGAEVSLAEGKKAASLCALCALALLQHTLGSLEAIQRILMVNVFVQSDSYFTLHNEIADAASKVFYTVLGGAGVHARNATGVHQLPKNAAVALDLIAAVEKA